MSARGITRAAVALTTTALWSNVLLPRTGLGIRGRTLASVGFATGYALVFRGRPRWCARQGWRTGGVAATIVIAGYGAVLAIPALRRAAGGFTGRGAEVSMTEWVAVHIPFGTVYGEELVFRGTLNPLLEAEFGTVPAAALGALAFGCWHIQPARAAGDNVAGTIVVTGLAGLIFGELRRRGDSATAAALAHLALNAGGALLSTQIPEAHTTNRRC